MKADQLHKQQALIGHWLHWSYEVGFSNVLRFPDGALEGLLAIRPQPCFWGRTRWGVTQDPKSVPERV
jgi:hypothetical protein